MFFDAGGGEKWIENTGRVSVVGFFGVVAGTDVKSAPTKVEAAKATVGRETVVLRRIPMMWN
jgi:hypothetical protein